ncbi:MAG: LacI family DNA-binding transcriptional regulator [Tessaracoccus sp.]
MPEPQGETTGRQTIYEVANAAGVSIATVSRVLSKPEVVSPTTRERVLRAVDELNYVPDGAARALAARNNEAYGLALPELSGPYYAELLTGFEAAAAHHEASVMVMLTRGKKNADAMVRRLAGRVDALAVMGNVRVKASTLQAIRRKIPVVTFAGEHHEGIEDFSTENITSAKELTSHLLDVHGRRNLLFLGDPSVAPDLRERYRGFVEAHEERTLTPRDPVLCLPHEAGGEKLGATLAHGLTSGLIHTDGLVCANDKLRYRSCDCSRRAARAFRRTSPSPAGTTCLPHATSPPPSPRCDNPFATWATSSWRDSNNSWGRRRQ